MLLAAWDYVFSRETDWFCVRLSLQLKNDLKNKPLKEVEEQDNTICWRGTKKFASPADLKNFFQSMVLNFGTAKNAAQLVIPPENYLIITVSIPAISC